MPARRRRGVPRREFVKAAVAIGGASALAACMNRESPDVPRGPSDLSSLPGRQHAWNQALATDDHGNDVEPRHHVLLLLGYDGDGTPTGDERASVEAAFESLERAYERSHDGLLFTVSYSRAYFDRFDDSLPESVDLPEPTAMSPFEDPEFDTPDAVVHLASDHGSVVLAAEAALTGESAELNGRSVEDDLTGVFSVVDRRTGFVGNGLPAKHQDVEGIPEGEPVPEDSPLFMGFKSGFKKNQASEDRVTIRDGPFAGGTTQHVSKITLRLDDWYVEQDHETRVAEMFCPAHAEKGLVEGTGEELGDSSGVDDCRDDIHEAAREYGHIGHTQKSAQAREDGSPIILRRDFDTTDDDQAGLHFVSLHRGIGDFVETREAMNGTDYTENPRIRQRVNNGILEYIFVDRRGNYLIPPRVHRSLPTPNPS